MKTFHLFLFTAIYLIFGFCNLINAQDSKIENERHVEIKINNQVYVCDTLSGFIQNKKYFDNPIEYINRCHFNVAAIEPYDFIFNTIFSEDRKKELNGTGLIIRLCCDSQGNVIEISFLTFNISKYTIKEINALESSFLKCKFKISNSCPEQKYYFFSLSHVWR